MGEREGDKVRRAVGGRVAGEPIGTDDEGIPIMLAARVFFADGQQRGGARGQVDQELGVGVLGAEEGHTLCVGPTQRVGVPNIFDGLLEDWAAFRVQNPQAYIFARTTHQQGHPPRRPHPEGHRIRERSRRSRRNRPGRPRPSRPWSALVLAGHPGAHQRPDPRHRRGAQRRQDPLPSAWGSSAP